MRADRARGLVFTEIARIHGVSDTFAHWAARHTPVVFVHCRWHLARWRQPEPVPPTLRLVHEIRGRGQWP